MCRRPSRRPPRRRLPRRSPEARSQNETRTGRGCIAAPARPSYVLPPGPSHAAAITARRFQPSDLGVPIALVILLVVFGAVVAAGLPILLSLLAITVAVGLTALVGQTFDVSVFAINMVSMMGLATGIDYSLFIISRFREERARGRDELDAIAVTGAAPCCSAA